MFEVQKSEEKNPLWFEVVAPELINSIKLNFK